MERMMGTREGLRELGTGYRVRAHQCKGPRKELRELGRGAMEGAEGPWKLRRGLR